MRKQLYCVLFILILSSNLFSVDLPTMIVGTQKGLFRIQNNNKEIPLWQEGSIKKIIKTQAAYYFLSDKGILLSKDLVSFEKRSEGLPKKVIKKVAKGKVYFETELQELKDISVDPFNQANLATCTKDTIYLSKNFGFSWQSFSSPVSDAVGLKNLVVFSCSEPVILVSHPIRGVFSLDLNNKNPKWEALNSGLALIQGTTVVDEVSSFSVSKEGEKIVVYCGNTFVGKLYKIDWKNKNANLLYSDKLPFSSVEAVHSNIDTVSFVSPDGVFRLGKKTLQVQKNEALSAFVKNSKLTLSSEVNCLYAQDDSDEEWVLSELWLTQDAKTSEYKKAAENKNGIYLVTDFMLNEKKTNEYFALMKARGINTLVIDMKDDYGHLRFVPDTPILKELGSVNRPLNVEKFIETAKKNNIYLVARIVVFKDQSLFEYSGSKYAIFDNGTKKPWRGTYSVQKQVTVAPKLSLNDSENIRQTVAGPKVTYETVKEFTKEYWVDPYSETVWQYNVAIAEEIIKKGFNEVQFDYIRFPTDGENLYNAFYRYKSEGMDKESALMSFLQYARENIKAPISIDIYGANGFYRTGVRTGQDVEILQRYVDVICPMYYPSHFEQSFYGYAPEVERPYRIYFYGTMRNYYIARKNVIVRPWLQAFYYAPASYDRAYYNLDYVRRETLAIKDAGSQGLTYWNNSGRYEDIPYITYNSNGSINTIQIPFK